MKKNLSHFQMYHNKSKTVTSLLLSVLCEQKCVTIFVIVKHLEVTLFQFLPTLYFVTYDVFNVSLVESLFCVEMQKTKNISFGFNKTKPQK